MNPVVVLLLVQLVAAQPVALPNPFADWNTKPSSSKVSVLDTQPLSRTRSLPQTSQSTNGNHAGKRNSNFSLFLLKITTYVILFMSKVRSTLRMVALSTKWAK
jgi:hypothetical protein